MIQAETKIISNFLSRFKHPHMAMNSVITIGKLFSDGFLNVERLPEALICCGLFGATRALELIIGDAPEGILVHHGMAPFSLYYAFLIGVVIFGIFETLAGLWVSEDLVGRRAVGMKILKASIGPLVFLLAALQAFASPK